MTVDARELPFFSRLASIPTLSIAHRGGSGVAPENTLAAFTRAVDVHRVDMLELDVHSTSDGVLVVAHDDVVDRCTDGHGAIASSTFAELARLDAAHRFSLDGGVSFPERGKGHRIPRLVELLETLPATLLNIELKPSAAPAAERFVAELRRAGALERVCIGSEDDALGLRLVELAPEACHFFPRDALIAAVFALKSGQSAEILDHPRLRVLDMPLHWEGMRLVDPAFLAAARARGLWVNVWTVDDEAELARCIDEQVPGIMTDRPDRLGRLLGRS